jgi:hypothetical protein
MHSIVMHRFVVQAFQDPPLCSSTVLDSFDGFEEKINQYYRIVSRDKKLGEGFSPNSLCP